ncbi:MAG: 50S ribosome-binding GTPase, partial [Phycisphaerales bacterium]|nr:50S ribosome-binding GTPase [Phycisphaerales bacterium]
RRVLDVDECVVCRWDARRVHVMPHAGRAVMRAMIAALEGAGIRGEQAGDPRSRYPEARDVMDACLCEALARAESPLAVDVVSMHAERWRSGEGEVLDDGSAHARALSHLMTPAVVVGWGPANVGKSSLLNALARRAVSIVADQPGTTRDHVGATLVVDGLTVRWIDAPGLGHSGSGEDAEAMRLAETALGSASLVVLMADRASGIPGAPVGYSGPVIRCGTRGDLGEVPGADVVTSAATGEGIGDLARAVRRRLVPDEALGTSGRWRFSRYLAG